MSIERTLTFVKPDAYLYHEKIKETYLKAGLQLVVADTVSLNEEQARVFYAVHKDKGFFNELAKFIASGEIYAMVFEGSDAVSRVRGLMKEKIRPEYASKTDLTKNAVHGSDSTENADQEMKFFAAINEQFRRCLAQ